MNKLSSHEWIRLNLVKTSAYLHEKRKGVFEMALQKGRPSRTASEIHVRMRVCVRYAWIRPFHTIEWRSADFMHCIRILEKNSAL